MTNLLLELQTENAAAVLRSWGISDTYAHEWADNVSDASDEPQPPVMPTEPAVMYAMLVDRMEHSSGLVWAMPDNRGPWEATDRATVGNEHADNELVTCDIMTPFGPLRAAWAAGPRGTCGEHAVTCPHPNARIEPYRCPDCGDPGCV